MATATKTKDQQATVTIDVTIKGGQGSAPRAEAHCHDHITWNIDGDIGSSDVVSIGRFSMSNGASGSPMVKPDAMRMRKGKGPIDDDVHPSATPDTYHYEVSVTPPSGAPSVIDPEIQIKP